MYTTTFKDSVSNLVTKMRDNGSKQRAVDLVYREAKAFPEYVSAVYAMEHGTAIARIMNDGSDPDSVASFQEAVSNLDRTRRSRHDSAQNACNILNRMCDTVGIEHICPDVRRLETKADRVPYERDLVSDFAGYVTIETFAGRDDGRHLTDEIRRDLESRRANLGKRCDANLDRAVSLMRDGLIDGNGNAFDSIIRNRALADAPEDTPTDDTSAGIEP